MSVELKVVQLPNLRYITYGVKCQKCKTGPNWNGKPASHVLRWAYQQQDNRRENIKLRCPNCDKQLSDKREEINELKQLLVHELAELRELEKLSV